MASSFFRVAQSALGVRSELILCSLRHLSEFVKTFDSLGLDASHATTLARNSFSASFASAAQKRGDLDRPDAYLDHAGVH